MDGMQHVEWWQVQVEVWVGGGLTLPHTLFTLGRPADRHIWPPGDTRAPRPPPRGPPPAPRLVVTRGGRARG